MLEFKEDNDEVKKLIPGNVYITEHKPGDGYMEFNIKNALKIRNQNLKFTWTEGKRPKILILSTEFSIYDALPEMLKQANKMGDNLKINEDTNIDIIISRFKKDNFNEEYLSKVIDSYNNDTSIIILLMISKIPVFSDNYDKDKYGSSFLTYTIHERMKNTEILKNISIKYHIPLMVSDQAPSIV